MRKLSFSISLLVRLLHPSKQIIEPGFRIAAIVVLSACSAIYPETMSQSLRPTERERFQSDYAECLQWAESQRPKVSFRDVLIPVSAAFLLAAIGAMVEYPRPIINDYKDRPLHPHHGGKALIAFSIAGVAAASGLIVAGMISRQRVEDAAMRSCLHNRGYSVDE